MGTIARTLATAGLVCVLVLAGAPSTAAAATEVVIDDFSGGVVAVNHPDGAGAYRVWYDARENAFGTPSSAMVDGESVMRIDDGGFTNGVYAIYEAAIPSNGVYRAEATIHVVEAGAVNGIRAYQVGVAVGGAAVHRGPNPSAVAPLTTVGSYDGLTPADDTAAGPQAVVTSPFAASAGDDLLVAFGTDVTSGGWNLNSGAWSGSYVVVDEIRLVADPTIVVDNDDGPDAYTETGSWTTGGATGYNGGTYRFASTGAASAATWTAQLPEAGFYDVEVIYRAGTNRASTAVYTVQTGDGVVAVPIDQTTRSLSWVYLGLFEFPAGPATITLDAAASTPPSAVVIADAVRFVPRDGPPPVDPPEMRLAAITVFDDIDDTDAIQRTVDELRRLRYNAIAVHTRFRGDATYVPNKANDDFPNSEPRNPAAGDIDVLEEFTARGHRAGMRVFAYVNTHLVTSGSTPETRPEHVVNVHPEWRTYAYNGGDPVVQTPAEDGEGLWLEPALPEVVDYLAGIAGDIMSNYDCDGIILDRIRYPQASFNRATKDFGYHPDAISAFNREFRTRGVPDPDDPDWIAFRQRAITDAVAAIYGTITDIDPDHLLLAYPIGRFGDAVNFNYQDWPDWLHRNAIDGTLPQIYNQDDAAFAASLAQNREAYGGDRLLGVTLDAFRAGNDLAGRIEAARVAGYDGTSPFRHGVMGPLGYFEDLRAAWDGVAEWPDLPGKGERIEPLEVRGTVEVPDGAPEWRITNPNAEALYVTWRVRGTHETGALYATPGETTWRTAGVPNGRVIVVQWYDERGRRQSEKAPARPERAAAAQRP